MARYNTTIYNEGTEFYHKGEGRIYVLRPEDIDEVIKTIKEVDDFEFNYLPKDFVVPWTGIVDLKYNGKFELNIDKFMEACFNGIDGKSPRFYKLGMKCRAIERSE